MLPQGSLVREGTIIPPGVLAAGIPAEIKRELNEREIKTMKEIEKTYVEYSRKYMK